MSVSIVQSLFSQLPTDDSASLTSEWVEEIIHSKNVRVERIVSFGHSSPETGWYEQAENEWVLLISGVGVIEYPCGHLVTLYAGDHLFIGAGVRHRVKETAPDEPTIWLAVFYFEH